MPALQLPAWPVANADGTYTLSTIDARAWTIALHELNTWIEVQYKRCGVTPKE